MSETSEQLAAESTETPASKPKRRSFRRRGGVFVVSLLVLSFVMGGAGAAMVLLGVTNYGWGSALGLNQAAVDNLTHTQTNHLVLEESSAITDAVGKVNPAVVSIATSRNVQNFFGQTVQEQGGGTGFILTSDGLIVTNKHVASNENTTYTVFTSDGQQYDAQVLAQDPLNDLAVLKINATGLPVVELGNSNDLKIGQYVIAIGNALGEFSNTVTVGVVSAKERQITAAGAAGGVSEQLSGLLQTDAAINPGNSGGPLVNLEGQVIGINTAIAGNAQNIGFAIPIDLVKNVIQSVRDTGEIKRPMLGIRYIPITKEIAQVNQLSVDYGAWVLPGSGTGEVAVIPGSPDDKAGIQENDIIIQIDGKKIDDTHSLPTLLASYNVGDTVTLTVLHKGDKEDVKVTLEASK